MRGTATTDADTAKPEMAPRAEQQSPDLSLTQVKGGTRIKWEVVSSLATLLSAVITAGTLFGFWYYQTPMFTAAAQVSDIDARLKRIELQGAETKNLLVTQQTRISLTVDTMKAIQSITPKVEFPPPRIYGRSSKEVELAWEVRNEGDFAFIIKELRIYFSVLSLDFSELDHSEQKDYKIIRQTPLKYAAPKGKLPLSVDVSWPNGWPREDVYWYVIMVVETDPDLLQEFTRGTDNNFNELLNKRKFFLNASTGRVLCQKRSTDTKYASTTIICKDDLRN